MCCSWPEKAANRTKFYADSQKSALVARLEEKTEAVKSCPTKLEVAQGIVYVQLLTAS